ncbi:MAG: 16S rRNA (cytidine(1402)-2'-O)-methyltransferase [Saprospiraceae bacterium]|jgi:16S rRNA (cytidine1402-2'-O)-methyltransferase|nr:16S rRNA (cytidine(1402)-2'-O)-methyltransferase [Saprospiraceae bacterium]MBK8297108.1 16S rRNA (cytidine(1402)-2'-O)-methyltransferase [Saprospiraceae bacterium]
MPPVKNEIKACLYLVPTPIGNLSDMTPRALGVLSAVDLILSEDTRVSNKLLMHFNIEKSLRSFHSQNEHKALQSIVDKLKEGASVALVTDAGTPGISDPAYLLVRACRKENIPVIALPGATAFVPALVASGLPCDRFFFNGFLPQKKGRNTQLNWLAALDCTIVLYESPHRLLKCLDELIAHFGSERQACFAKEISKLFEKYITGSLQEIKEQLASEKIVGEWVIVIGGS